LAEAAAKQAGETEDDEDQSTACADTIPRPLAHRPKSATSAHVLLRPLTISARCESSNRGVAVLSKKLVISEEVGVVLRCQAEFRGDAFRVIEVDQIAVDERFGDEMFDPDLIPNGVVDP
jgi:hypothetical protein